MAVYSINKGIGKTVEFRGLKAQYLFIFAGGLLLVFILFIVMYMAGVGEVFCIGFGLLAASLLVWQTFRLNARYGEYGLMKLSASRYRPRYLLNRPRRKFRQIDRDFPKKNPLKRMT